MFASASSGHADARVAVGEVVGHVLEHLGRAPDLAVLFFTEAHVTAAAEIAAAVQILLEPAALIGASAAGVIGGGSGTEDAPGLVLWAGRLGGRVTPFHAEARTDGNGVGIGGLDAAALDTAATVLVLADPFSFPAAEFLDGIGADHPGTAAIGGLASAARVPGGNRLVIGGRVVATGAVGVLLDQLARPATVVSQGCRPIGRPWTVTRAEHNLLHELGGRPALERLGEILEALEPEDRALAAQGLHCGIVVDEHRLDFGRGDFLVRGVLGADRRTGTVAVGDVVPVGATVQFQVRDPDTAGDDLRLLLLGRAGDAALVFTCTGRGTAMFGDPHHDARVVEDHLGPRPIAGMFCAGEVGPVAGRNALHTFTASIAVFTAANAR